VTSNLTRDEAATRSALITVSSYHVDLDLTGDDSTFRSVSVVRFSCTAPGSSTHLDLTAPAVREITLNDAPVAPNAFDGDRITLTGLAADNVLRVTADCAYSHSGEGLHRFTDPADGRVYLYSDL
jgi:aminopeptidase N